MRLIIADRLTLGDARVTMFATGLRHHEGVTHIWNTRFLTDGEGRPAPAGCV